MKGTYLGEFQEIVLLSVMVLDQNAYGVSIQDEIQSRLQRDISRGALHAALSRLEDKGYLRSEWGESTAERGGRRKKMYQVTRRGQTALMTIRDIRKSYWEAIPKLSFT